MQDERDREPARALPGPPRGDPQAARVVQRGRDRGARRVRGTAPLPATRDGMAAERARADPTSQRGHRGRRGSLSCCSSRRLGSAARSRARAAGPRRRSGGGRVDPRRARASDAGALQGAAAGHRSAAGAAARGAGRDRDRGRQHRPSALGRRRVDARGRAVREQGAGRRRDPCSRAGCGSPRAIRRTRSGSAPKPRGSGARSGRPTRRRWRGPVSPKRSARAATSTGPLWSSKRPARCSTGSKPSRRPTTRCRSSRTAERRSQPVTDLNMFRREGDYWSVVFEGRTVRVRDLKGMRYLARLLADPGREFHVLDLVAAESGRLAGPRAAVRRLSHTALGDAGEMLDARAKDAYRRRLAEIEDDIEQARALGDTERPTQADAERDFLVRELSRAVGLGGRDRRAASASERARVSVTRAVRQAIARIGEHHPELGEHLDRTIRTGTYCAYVPDTRRSRRLEVVTSARVLHHSLPRGSSHQRVDRGPGMHSRATAMRPERASRSRPAHARLGRQASVRRATGSRLLRRQSRTAPTDRNSVAPSKQVQERGGLSGRVSGANRPLGAVHEAGPHHVKSRRPSNSRI